MKKLLKSLLIFCFVIITFTGVNASARDDLTSYLNQNHVIAGETITLTAYQKTQVERYLNSYTVTNSQISIFKSKVEEIRKIINLSGTTDLNKLKTSEKNKIINLVKDAGLSVGITITFNSTNNTVELYNSAGDLLDVFSLSSGKLPFTGTNILFYIIIAVISLIIVMIFVFKRRFIDYLSNFVKPLKVTGKLLIVAFGFTCISLLMGYVLFNEQINMIVSTLKLISVNNDVVEQNAIMKVSGDGSKLIENYPYYGQAYGNIVIASVGITLPIYFGDSLEILKNGAGHMTESYFPGEGASIIIGAHHSEDKFGNLKNIKLNDTIEVDTSYGKFNYIVNDLKVINETDLDLLPIQKDKEILMLYTCYPFGYLGYTTKRYVVYANLLDYKLSEVKQ